LQNLNHRILEERLPKNPVNLWQPYAYFVEKERASDGFIKDVATLFLTNKECPFHCLMCDLWKNTTDERVPVGAIPAQIELALQELPKTDQIKLYNSGSFFDPKAIPPEDFLEIANLLEPFQTVIVESHPRFINKSCLEFRDMLKADLQVAIGLETARPDVLKKLNKHMALTDFSHSVGFLHHHNISVRAFILLNPPFLNEPESVLWAKKSIDFAFDQGVECCVIIPTRGGNGIMEQLQNDGLFTPPTIESLEEVLEYGIQKKSGRVFADLWDIEKFSTWEKGSPERIERMQTMNLDQFVPPLIKCNC
jgi:archaeosine synthase beta-subunit